MGALATELRRQLERTVTAAREAAEEAAQAAVTALGVQLPAAPAGLTPARVKARVRLRARARQLGGGGGSAETRMARGLPLLVEEIAYVQWHRMLFARFLAENGLLIHPEYRVPVTLEQCEQIVREEEAEGKPDREPDAWMLSARYAAVMLPGIFPLDDPAAQVRLAPEGRRRLEKLLDGLPPQVFTADDALGWVYQFWQSKKKAEVNKAERKIGGDDLAPVTQLFTEHYMVQFLLENTLGAWWAARHPDSPLIRTFEYLRFRDAGAPGAEPRPPGVGEPDGFPNWSERPPPAASRAGRSARPRSR